MARNVTETSVQDWEAAQVSRANATDRTPVVFVHGLWLLPSSWDRWATLFAATSATPYPAPVQFDTFTATRTRSDGFGFRQRDAK